MPTIPQRALRRLEFLSGEYEGVQTLIPPGGQQSVTYEVVCTISREICDRFVKLEFFADVPGSGVESFSAFLTYHPKQENYQMWLFSSTADEPLHMMGNFIESELVMVSDPWSMPWGLQRLRGTFTPTAEGNFRYLTELWEPDGYVQFRKTSFYRRRVGDS